MWLSIEEFRHENTTRRYDLLVCVRKRVRRLTNCRHTVLRWLTSDNKAVVGRITHWMPEPGYPYYLDNHRRK